MSSKTCPVCGDRFDSAGSVRDHAWDSHRACHYCDTQLEDADSKTDLYKHWLLAHPEELRTVDAKQADSAVGSISFSDRLESQGVGAAVSGLPRRYFLVAGGATGVAAIAGGGAVLASRSGGLLSNEANPVEEYEYARIGPDDPAATITYFGSYKCGHCADFNAGMFQDLYAEYVEPGDLAIRYRNLSYFGGDPFLGGDAPNPGHAGLAVYNNEPEAYLDYHDYIFENHGTRWNVDRLVDGAREVGVSDPSVVRTAVEQRQYVNALEATDEEAQQIGVDATPSLVIEGTVITPAPGEVRPLIEDAIASE